jgi:GTPase SAR1 family protein
VDDAEHKLEIVDTAGQEEFASFRDSSLDYGTRHAAWSVI